MFVYPEKNQENSEKGHLVVPQTFDLNFLPFPGHKNHYVASSGIRPGTHLPDWSPCHLVCHFSTSLRLPSLRIASFAQAITCRFAKQVSSLRSWKVSFLSSANKSIRETLARTSTALFDTLRYVETILSTTPPCAENSFIWIRWLLRALVRTGAA